MSKTLEIKTDYFCENFNIKHPDDLQENMYQNWDLPAPTDQEIEEWLGQYDIEDTEENRDQVAEAANLTQERDTSDRIYEAWKEQVGSVLEVFQDYPYEYFVEGEFKSYSGRTKGIISYSIYGDKIGLTVADDFGHIINDCLAGYGLIDPEEPGDDMPVDYMETRFHWLKYYFEIYGERMPQMSDVEPEFKNSTFKIMLEDMGLLGKSKTRKRK